MRFVVGTICGLVAAGTLTAEKHSANPTIIKRDLNFVI